MLTKKVEYHCLKGSSFFKYLLQDVGSNVGIQVRKLFEIGQFPNATITKMFDHYFGPHTTNRNTQGKVLVKHVKIYFLFSNIF